MSHRLWEKSVTDFGKICRRLSGKIGSVLGKDLGKLVWFLDWLATKLKSHCLESQASLGFGGFKTGCHYKNKSTSGKLEG